MHQALKLKGQAHVGTIEVLDGIVVGIAMAETEVEPHPVVVGCRHNGQACVVVSVIPIFSIYGATHSSRKRAAKGLTRIVVNLQVAQTEAKTTAKSKTLVPSLHTILLK